MFKPIDAPFRRIPARTIALTIFMVWIAIHTDDLLTRVTPVFRWIIIAIFFTMILSPVVDLCVRRLHLRKGFAALLVFIVGFAALAGLLYAFVHPLADSGPKFIKSFPTYIDQAKDGEGPIGDLVIRFHLQDDLDKFNDISADVVNTAKENAADIGIRVSSGVAGAVTVLVLTILMLLGGTELIHKFISPLNSETQKRILVLGQECAHVVNRYVFGNLLISVVAGFVTFVALWLLGVPFKGVLGLWVAFADLIPLVGATLGAIPVILVAFIHSTTSGIVMIAFFIVYQQFENHVLQVTVMSKTVQLDPLVVLIAVLLGVALFGILGALLAIPAAGTIQVIVRDLLAHRYVAPGETPAQPVDTQL